MPITTAVDPREFARFIVTGLTSTLGNLAAVWFARGVAPFEVALFAGIAAGLAISFLLSKVFAFGSRSWAGAGGEAVRFLLVYAVGCGVYWATAVVVGHEGKTLGVPGSHAELLGVLAGAGAMMVVTYLGHRFFTYGTHRQTKAGGGV